MVSFALGNSEETKSLLLETLKRHDALNAEDRVDLHIPMRVLQLQERLHDARDRRRVLAKAVGIIENNQAPPTEAFAVDAMRVDRHQLDWYADHPNECRVEDVLETGHCIRKLFMSLPAGSRGHLVAAEEIMRDGLLGRLLKYAANVPGSDQVKVFQALGSLVDKWLKASEPTGPCLPGMPWGNGIVCRTWLRCVRLLQASECDLRILLQLSQDDPNQDLLNVHEFYKKLLTQVQEQREKPPFNNTSWATCGIDTLEFGDRVSKVISADEPIAPSDVPSVQECLDHVNNRFDKLVHVLDQPRCLRKDSIERQPIEDIETAMLYGDQEAACALVDVTLTMLCIAIDQSGKKLHRHQPSNDIDGNAAQTYTYFEQWGGALDRMRDMCARISQCAHEVRRNMVWHTLLDYIHEVATAVLRTKLDVLESPRLLERMVRGNATSLLERLNKSYEAASALKQTRAHVSALSHDLLQRFKSQMENVRALITFQQHMQRVPGGILPVQFTQSSGAGQMLPTSILFPIEKLSTAHYSTLCACAVKESANVSTHGLTFIYAQPWPGSNGQLGPTQHFFLPLPLPTPGSSERRICFHDDLKMRGEAESRTVVRVRAGHDVFNSIECEKKPPYAASPPAAQYQPWRHRHSEQFFLNDLSQLDIGMLMKHVPAFAQEGDRPVLLGVCFEVFSKYSCCNWCKLAFLAEQQVEGEYKSFVMRLQEWCGHSPIAAATRIVATLQYCNNRSRRYSHPGERLEVQLVPVRVSGHSSGASATTSVPVSMRECNLAIWEFVLPPAVASGSRHNNLTRK